MLETVNAFIWGNLLLSLLLGTGLYYTVRMRGFQLRGMGRVLRCTFSGCRSRTAGSGRISQLQTMSAALAATMGTGNIVGVATALTLGGTRGDFLDVDLRHSGHAAGVCGKYAGSIVPVPV